MKHAVLLSAFVLIQTISLAQQTLSNEALPPGYTDGPDGTEIIGSPSNQSVHFAQDGNFTHQGQFYVASTGRYYGVVDGGFNPGVDYFGYAPVDVSSYNGPYLGSGIQGASNNHGGSGAAVPVFTYLKLTSTGLFPLTTSITIQKNLFFATNPGSGGSVITVPDGQEVLFYDGMEGSTGTTYGTNDANYIDGTIHAYTYNEATTLFAVGDRQNTTHPYHPATIYNSFRGSPQVRYLNANPIPVSTDYLGPGLGAVSTVGYWRTNGLGLYTSISVSIPQPEGLGANPNPANLRLVGWTGTKWVILENIGQGAKAPAGGGGADLNGYTLVGSGPGPHDFSAYYGVGIGTIDGAPMPVNLIAFTGSWKERAAELSWQTSWEKNNDHFEIQRSADAKSFESIGRVAGKGTQQATTDYAFTDTQMLGDLAYYRLKQVDTDGKYSFSSIISVRRGVDTGPAILSISPNPVQKTLTLSLSTGQIKTVRIFDVGGRLLQTASVLTPDVSGLRVGTYIVEITTTSGQVLKQRFVKE